MKIQEYLQQNIILTDGAMGTYFDQIEPELYDCSEEANLLNPELILKIHREYIDSGANLIRSNTFCANRKTWELLRQKRGETFAQITMEEWATAGFRLAQQAADEAVREGKHVWAAADIGPISENQDSEEREILKEYTALINIYLEAGADIFVLETFPDEKYVLYMAEYIRKKCPDAFILGQFAFAPTGYSRSGAHYRMVLDRALESGWLDAAGLNCGVGAAHMEQFFRNYLSERTLPAGKYLTALPNRGYPQIVRGRAVYSDSVDYYGSKMQEIADMGIQILGGCCGTTPDYIRAIARLTAKDAENTNRTPCHIRFTSIEMPKEKEEGDAAKSHRVSTVRNHFREKLLAGEKVYALELDPPFDASPDKMLDGAAQLVDSPVDVITVADSPLARARADSLLMASRIQRDTGVPVMPHLSCRDRNRIALRSNLLGAHINDIRNLLIVTGDPVGREEREFTKSVFDFNSIKLMEYVRGMNEDVFAEEPLFYGGALNQNGANPERIADRMKRKIEAGCSFFLTQPVYSEKELERISRLSEQTGGKILIGIMPLISYRNARFIRNEMPGIYVPDDVMNQYDPEGNRESWEDTAIEISRQIMEKSRDIGAGYYLMTPFQRVGLMKRILQYIDGGKKQ